MIEQGFYRSLRNLPPTPGWYAVLVLPPWHDDLSVTRMKPTEPWPEERPSADYFDGQSWTGAGITIAHVGPFTSESDAREVSREFLALRPI